MRLDLFTDEEVATILTRTRWQFAPAHLRKLVVELNAAVEEKIEQVAWTGRGCGVINNRAKDRMTKDGKYGGEFAAAAKLAEKHDTPLYAIKSTKE